MSRQRYRAVPVQQKIEKIDKVFAGNKGAAEMVKRLVSCDTSCSVPSKQPSASSSKIPPVQSRLRAPQSSRLKPPGGIPTLKVPSVGQRKPIPLTTQTKETRITPPVPPSQARPPAQQTSMVNGQASASEVPAPTVSARYPAQQSDTSRLPLGTRPRSRPNPFQYGTTNFGIGKGIPTAMDTDEFKGPQKGSSIPQKYQHLYSPRTQRQQPQTATESSRDMSPPSYLKYTPPPSPPAPVSPAEKVDEFKMSTDAFLARVMARHPDLPPAPSEYVTKRPVTPPRKLVGIPGWDSPERPLPSTPPIHQMPVPSQMLDWIEPPVFDDSIEMPESPPFKAPDVSGGNIFDFAMPDFPSTPPRTPMRKELLMGLPPSSPSPPMSQRMRQMVLKLPLYDSNFCKSTRNNQITRKRAPPPTMPQIPGSPPPFDEFGLPSRIQYSPPRKFIEHPRYKELYPETPKQVSTPPAPTPRGTESPDARRQLFPQSPPSGPAPLSQPPAGNTLRVPGKPVKGILSGKTPAGGAVSRQPPQRATDYRSSSATRPPQRAISSGSTAATRPPQRAPGSGVTAATRPPQRATGSGGTAATRPPQRATGSGGTAATRPPQRVSGPGGTAATRPPQRASGYGSTAATRPPQQATGYGSAGTSRPTTRAKPTVSAPASRTSVSRSSSQARVVNRCTRKT